jgi:hypothetical protein
MATTFAATSAGNGHRRLSRRRANESSHGKNRGILPVRDDQHIVELTQTFRPEPEK